MIRKASIFDIDSIEECLVMAKLFLKESNSLQWNTKIGSPTKESYLKDINNDSCYVYEKNGRVIGVISILNREVAYEASNLKWIIKTNKYLTIHRICVRKEYMNQGIGKELIKFAINLAKEKDMDSIRIDTHEKNKIMQNLVLKLGFIPCGDIYYDTIPEDPKRLIYELVINK